MPDTPKPVKVTIVRRIGDDIERMKHVPVMTMPEALADLRMIRDHSPRALSQFDVVYVNDDDTLGRYASWAL